MNSRELASLAIRRVFVLLFFFYYRLQGFEHLEGEAHYAVVLAPNLEVDGTVVVVDERFGEEPLVVVKPLSPLWDGRALNLARLLSRSHLMHLRILLIGFSRSIPDGDVIACPVFSPFRRSTAKGSKHDIILG